MSWQGRGGRAVRGLVFLILAIVVFRVADHVGKASNAEPGAEAQTVVATPAVEVAPAAQVAPVDAVQAMRNAARVIASKEEPAPSRAWSGPKWHGKHAATRFDRIFEPTDADRAALTDALVHLDATASLGLLCEIRAMKWSASVSHHVTELLEDPGIALGDPIGIEHARATYREAIDYEGRVIEKSVGTPELKKLCVATLLAGDFLVADEIAQRRLLRRHDEWEGAGGQ